MEKSFKDKVGFNASKVIPSTQESKWNIERIRESHNIALLRLPVSMFDFLCLSASQLALSGSHFGI